MTSKLPSTSSVLLVDTLTLLNWQENALYEVDLGKPVVKVLLDFLHKCEKAAEGRLCVSFILRSQVYTLEHVLSECLPTACHKAIAELDNYSSAILPDGFVFNNEPVLLNDIAFVPEHTRWRQLMLDNGLRAFWCWPMRAYNNESLGVLACYIREPAVPTTEAKNVLALIAQTGRLALMRQAAMHSMRDAQHRHRQIFDSAIDFAIIATDLHGVVTDWNEGARRVLGWSARESVGFRLQRIFLPEDVARKRPEAEMRCTLENGFSPDERWHLRKSGERFWAVGQMTPLKSAEGSVIGFVKVMRDQTAQKVAEQVRDA